MLLSQECHAICHVTSLVSCVVTWTRNTWYDTLLTAVTLVKTCNNIVTFNPLLWQQITMHSYTSDRPTDAIKSTFTLFLKTILYMSSNKSLTKSVQSCWRPRHTHTLLKYLVQCEQKYLVWTPSIICLILQEIAPAWLD